MCGIFGWQWHHTPPLGVRMTLATGLSLLNTTRGSDSWGYSPHPDIRKRGLGGMAHEVSAEELAEYPGLIAHTRYKTAGAVSVENAHPFDIGNIVGAHNGCIYNSWTLDTKYENRDHDVDSMHIFSHINEGLDLSELQGYGAIEYYDRREPGTIYLGRFCSGELAVEQIPGRGIVWSSARNHLDTVLKLAGLYKDSRRHSIHEGLLYYAKAGVLYETKQKLPVEKAHTKSYTYVAGTGTVSTLPTVSDFGKKKTSGSDTSGGGTATRGTAGETDDGDDAYAAACAQYDAEWLDRTTKRREQEEALERQLARIPNDELFDTIEGHEEMCDCMCCEEFGRRLGELEDGDPDVVELMEREERGIGFKAEGSE